MVVVRSIVQVVESPALIQQPSGWAQPPAGGGVAQRKSHREPDAGLGVAVDHLQGQRGGGGKIGDGSGGDDDVPLGCVVGGSAVLDLEPTIGGGVGREFLDDLPCGVQAAQCVAVGARGDRGVGERVGAPSGHLVQGDRAGSAMLAFHTASTVSSRNLLPQLWYQGIHQE